MILTESMLDVIILKCSHNVAPSTMRAIIKTESRGNPLAIGINGRIHLSYQAKNYQQAYRWVLYLENNHYNIDIGIAQINIKNVRKYGYKGTDMLDPCLNIKVANFILLDNFKKLQKYNLSVKDSLFMTISAYNTGNYKSGFNNGYVMKVLNNAKI
jgi:type IV secretion system protein VirB1